VTLAVEQQPDPTAGQLGAGRRQPVWPAEHRVDDVVADTVRRPDDVVRAQIGKRFPP
jgi:hypothetical protein